MNNELISHLIELRKRLVFIVLGFLIIFIILFPFANHIFSIVAKPLIYYLPQNTQLIATDITSPFFVPLKLTAICACLISLPNTIYQIWHYIAPGLYQKEQNIFLSVTISAIFLFSSGILFCYYLVFPTLFHFISKIKASEVLMFTDITKYLDFILSMCLIFGICFEMPIIIFLLVYFNIIDTKKLCQFRSYILVGCFIIAAIVTPPDVFSQIMLAIPLYLLYEIGIIASKLFLSNHEVKE